MDLRQDLRRGIIMGNQSLVLQSMGRNATGNYYCVATNAEGTTFSNPVQLDIKCKQNCSLKLVVVGHFQCTYNLSKHFFLVLNDSRVFKKPNPIQIQSFFSFFNCVNRYFGKKEYCAVPFFLGSLSR